MVTQLQERIHTKVTRCVNMFLLLTNKVKWKTNILSYLTDILREV